jgi:hypothetical protein
MNETGELTPPLLETVDQAPPRLHGADGQDKPISRLRQVMLGIAQEEGLDGGIFCGSVVLPQVPLETIAVGGELVVKEVADFAGEASSAQENNVPHALVLV